MWYLEHFKVEIFVFTLCIAVSIGMVVQKMSQASIPSQTRSTTSLPDNCSKLL